MDWMQHGLKGFLRRLGIARLIVLLNKLRKTMRARAKAGLGDTHRLIATDVEADLTVDDVYRNASTGKLGLADRRARQAEYLARQAITADAS